ncbi:MAG: hypothetical protein WD426_16630, partial [Anditalea sp.]
MKKTVLALIITWFALPGVLFSQNADSRAGDEQALVDLYNATDGPNWHDRTGWSGTSINLNDEISGITSELRDGELRVVRVDMQKIYKAPGKSDASDGNNLTGFLPESIGNLTKVEYFNVKQNKLSGEIPESIGNMSSLKWLSLGGQRCDVSIYKNSSWNSPNHRGCSESGKEFEETNEFSGTIPPSIGRLINLELFEARRQYLSGELPAELGQLSKLIGLFLNDQKGDGFGGNIPSEWGGLVNLKWLDLSNDNGEGAGYTGAIPQEVLDLPELRHIRLRHNSLSGEIPVFSGAYDIRVIALSDNNFTGTFPIEYFQGKNAFMSMFDISGNYLAGEIPTNFIPPHTPRERDNYNTISYFELGGNDFTGPLPQWIQEFRDNQQLKFSGIGFTGPFPKTMAEQHKVRLFWISGNEFSGDLPDVNWTSDNLYSVMIGGNNFTGPIPESWKTILTNHVDGNGNFEGRIWRFYANNNELSGEIPEWLSQIPTLERIGLDNNRFTFKDILPNYDAIKKNLQNAVDAPTGRGSEPEFNLFPQKPFGQEEQITLSEGVLFTFDYSHRTDPSDNMQWTKNGQPVPGATGPVLTISALTPDDAGTYRLELSNSNLPDLGTLVSEPIELRIGEGGGSSSDSPPSTPQLSSPSNGTDGVAVSPVLNWNSTSNAETYRLQVSQGGGSFSPVIDEQDISTSSYQLNSIAYETGYSWRVRAVNENGESDWSEIWSFTTITEENKSDNEGGSSGDEGGSGDDAPELISPASNAEDVPNHITFEWSTLDADEYILHVTRANESGSHDEFFYSDNEGVMITETNYTVQKESLPGV